MKKSEDASRSPEKKLTLSKTTIKALAVRSTIQTGLMPTSPITASNVTCATVCGRQCIL